MREINDKEIGVLVALGSMGAGVDSYILKDVERIESLTGYSRGVLYSILNRLLREKIIEQKPCKHSNEIRREVRLTERGYECLHENYVYVLQSLRNARANSRVSLSQHKALAVGLRLP